MDANATLPAAALQAPSSSGFFCACSYCVWAQAEHLRILLYLHNRQHPVMRNLCLLGRPSAEQRTYAWMMGHFLAPAQQRPSQPVQQQQFPILSQSQSSQQLNGLRQSSQMRVSQLQDQLRDFQLRGHLSPLPNLPQQHHSNNTNSANSNSG